MVMPTSNHKAIKYYARRKCLQEIQKTKEMHIFTIIPSYYIVQTYNHGENVRELGVYWPESRCLDITVVIFLYIDFFVAFRKLNFP